MSNKKISLIAATLLLLSVFVQGWVPPPPEGDSPPLPPQQKITYDSTLQITEVITEVDGKKDAITNTGEKISKEAKQESDIEFKINVKNIWDKKIQDIDVEVIIKDIDGGDDLDNDANIDELDPGDSEKVDIDIDLPLKVDDDTYDVEIIIRGKDEDYNLHTIDWELKLEVQKEKHNVKITEVSLSPSIVQCGGTTSLEIDLLNLGRDEEEVNLEIKNEELGINFKEKDIELDTGTDDDAQYEKNLRLNIPINIGSGTYPITVDAHYNKDKSTATKKANLIIEDCIQTRQSPVSIKSLPPTTSETLSKLQTKTPQTIISTPSDESMILLLSITLVIILGLIIFLLGVIMVQLKK